MDVSITYDGAVLLLGDWPVYLEYRTFDDINKLLVAALESQGGAIGSKKIAGDEVRYYLRSDRIEAVKNIGLHALVMDAPRWESPITIEERNRIIEVCREWKRKNGYEYD